jgi:hypothetical protein
MSDELSPEMRELLSLARVKVAFNADSQGDYRWHGPGDLEGQGITPLDAARNALVCLAWAAEELALARAEVQALELSLSLLARLSGDAPATAGQHTQDQSEAEG